MCRQEARLGWQLQEEARTIGVAGRRQGEGKSAAEGGQRVAVQNKVALSHMCICYATVLSFFLLPATAPNAAKMCVCGKVSEAWGR